MLARIRSAAVLGVDAYLMEVEVDITTGLPSFSTVGLPQGAVKEGRERVNAAVVNAGFDFPIRRITVNLAPADIRKDGSALDLPIALGILVASGQLDGEPLRDRIVLGELGLEGDLRPVRGALSMALAARAAGSAGIVLPHANLPEASVVEGLEVRGARSLAEICEWLQGGAPLATMTVDLVALMAARGGTWWISRTYGARRRPSARSRWRRQAATTSSSSGRQVPGRRCWRAASPPSCRR